MSKVLRLGEILVREGFCTWEDVKAALAAQAKGDRRRLGEILLSMGKITEEQLEKALAIQWMSAKRPGF